ncbi:unnamed protein product [Echinostoma caproni]|uniref:Large ribosomal subunit protein uL23m n=1 Tax=Echinostoma caproni TaxID=27848 RepID=A0A183B9P4_9TREM|nr:unnamed protein product [Echinostoma caproni]
MRPVIFIRPICLPKTPHYVPLWQRYVEYPKFTPGDPRPRCFLPPYWMKMLYPGPHNPPDHVVFKVHPQMTKYDVQQYLEKIYNVPVVHVRVKPVFHDLEPNDQPTEKMLQRVGNPFMFPPKPERYEKLAYVRLAPGTTFEFPDLFKTKRTSDALDAFDTAKLESESEESAETTKLATVRTESDETKSPAVSADEVKLQARGLPTWFSR